MIFPLNRLRENDFMEVFVTRHGEKEIFLFVIGWHTLLKPVNFKLRKPLEKITANDQLKLELKKLFLDFQGIHCLLVAGLLQFFLVSSLEQQVTSIIYYPNFSQLLGRCMFQFLPIWK